MWQHPPARQHSHAAPSCQSLSSLPLPHPALQYVFSFSYDQGGNVHMTAGGSKQTFSTKDPAPSKSKVGGGQEGSGLAGQGPRALPVALLCAHPPLWLPLLTTVPAFLPRLMCAAGAQPDGRQVAGPAPHAHAGGDHKHPGAGGCCAPAVYC